MSTDKIKYALITGASRGIGAACAKAIAKMGYHVVINYRSNHDAAQKVMSEISEDGEEASLLPFDVSDRDGVRKILTEWMGDRERYFEILINNAGARQDNSLLWMEDHEWDGVLDGHLNGFYNVTKTVLQPMVMSRYGRIVNVVSLSGLKGMMGQTNYSAAKAGVIGASKALAQEVAKRKVTVNCVAPGFIKTDMTADIEEGDYKNLIPVRRFGTAEEVAATVAFLASRGASYITGEVISVNGGLYS